MIIHNLRKGPCAFEESVWKQDATSLECSSPDNDYHCVPNENNILVELCIQHIWVDPNYCPVYNTGANTLDTVPCNVTTGSCPSTRIWSNEIYKYPVCLNKTFTDGKNVSNEAVSLPLGILIGVPVSLFIVFFALFLIGHCICRRRQYRRGNEEIPFDDFSLEKPFYKTSAFHEGVNFITSGGEVLCLVGQWGSGKRSTAKQVYVAVTKSSPIMISNPLTFDVKDYHEPIIVDMTLSIGMSKSEKEDLGKKIHMFFENMSSSSTCTKAFIIFLHDEDQYDIANVIRSLVKGTKFIDLSKSFTKGDRTQILYSQFEAFCRNKNFSEVEKLAVGKGKEHSLGYPEICALFCRCGHFQTVGPKTFCNQPLRYLKSYLEKMHRSNDKETFLMLVYMSLNKMKINVDDDKNDKLLELLESCNCDTFEEETKCKTEQMESTGTETTEETSNIQQGLSSKDKPKKHCKSKEDIPSFIPKEFVIKEASIYRLQHDVIKRMTLIVYGTYHFDKLLELSKPEELKAWVKEKGMIPDVGLGDIKPVLEIDREQWRQFQAKLSY